MNQPPAQSDAVLLARIDERTRAMSSQLDDVKRGQADLSSRMDSLTKDVDAKLATHGDNYVTRDEFGPVRAIAYGIVSVVLLGVIGALVALVLRSNP